MLSRLFKKRIPFWAALAVILFLSGFVVFLNQSRITTYQYLLSLGDGAGNSSPFKYGAWPTLENADFFKRVRDDFIAKQANFIEADLSEMVIRVYKGGLVTEEFPILTKGKKGSWWETPAGIYEIKSKEKNHFSSIGGVYMPYSMQFQGNFFIHGWPYYEDGSPVGSQYSGGCVRLKTEDAEKIFNSVSIGTPVLVFESDLEPDGFTERVKVPEIVAARYLAADLKNNFVFIEKASTEPVPIASITKMMTAVVATEHINLDKEIMVEESMLVKTTRPRLVAGEDTSAYSLLFPLLLESSNEAAEALASFLGRENFVRLMNKNTRSLGMNHTSFTDPSGSDDENISTAEDLFNLAKYLYGNRSFILRISSGRVYSSAYGETPFPRLENFNEFQGDPAFVGGKVGISAAASGTMMSIFELPMRGEVRPIAVIVLGTPDYRKDTEAILEYIKQNYE